jgi:hypothetical protein
MSKLSKLKVAAVAATVLVLRRRRRRQKMRERVWIQPWNEKRLEQGVNINLMNDLKNDRPNYRMYTRVDREQFEDLLLKVEGSITRQNTNFRSAISAEERLPELSFCVTGCYN